MREIINEASKSPQEYSSGLSVYTKRKAPSTVMDAWRFFEPEGDNS